jgi:hypothetical protein
MNQPTFPRVWKFIVIGLLVFVAVFHVVAIVVLSGMRFDLTSSDYYERGNRYEEVIQAEKRGTACLWTWRYHQGRMEVSLAKAHEAMPLPDPDRVILELKRTNDARLDQKITLEKEEGRWRSQPIALNSGKWSVAASFDWQGQSYLKKGSLILDN